MSKTVTILAIFCVILLNYVLGSEVQEPQLNTAAEDVIFNIEHSLDGKNFIPRSSFKIQLSNNNKIVPIENERNGILNDNLESFKSLLEHNDFYRIRISNQLGVDASNYVMASIPACELQKSGFKEDISIHLDETRSFIVGLSYSSPVIAMSRQCNPSKVASPQLFLTRAKVVEKVAAQSIPLQVSAPPPPQLANVNLEGDDDSKGPKAPKQQQSFLMQYWYLVIPMVLFMFAPTAEDDKKGNRKKNQ